MALEEKMEKAKEAIDDLLNDQKVGPQEALDNGADLIDHIQMHGAALKACFPELG